MFEWDKFKTGLERGFAIRPGFPHLRFSATSAVESRIRVYPGISP
jgi:hypothetical protein